jgi:hypothetical protein
MSLTKRIDGDYTIETIGAFDNVRVNTDTMTIDGNLVVLGSGGIVSIETVNMQITDNVIHLNQGELGAGITDDETWGNEIPAGPVKSSGIRIKRGSLNDVGVRYNDFTNTWQLTNDGIAWEDIAVGAVGLFNVHEDTTPALGGDLDVNGWKIVSNTGEDTNSNGTTDTLDITIEPAAGGLFKVNSDSTGSGISIEQQSGDPAGTEPGYNKVYSKATGAGGSGLYFKSSTDTDELVSKTKAIVFGIVF